MKWPTDWPWFIALGGLNQCSIDKIKKLRNTFADTARGKMKHVFTQFVLGRCTGWTLKGRGFKQWQIDDGNNDDDDNYNDDDDDDDNDDDNDDDYHDDDDDDLRGL